MDSGELVVSSLVSILTGLVLWAVLPRGVVLTRTTLTRDHAGEPIFGTWQVRNDSALPVKLTSVTYLGVNTYDEVEGKILELDLPKWVPHEEEADLGITLHFDDEVLELTRDADDREWAGQEVPPGDTLTAYVNLNRTLRIKYRRAGILGVFERRKLTIDGGV